eukprot:TRINITY_DN47_c0_g1_i1.p1 TRINITY_DN47_c0_g1~~TRINITY_DN47_c0_g1_i1.p1  ORF type:complete len:359 (-),score=232.94 TRINITY_DN47_c0_g1_i1:165-1241(-)
MTKDTKIAKKNAKTEVAKAAPAKVEKAAPAKVDKKAGKKAVPAKKVESSESESSESSESEDEKDESEEESSESESEEKEEEESEEESEEEKMIDHKRKREEQSAGAPASKVAKSEDTNVFVGGLPFAATEESVKQFFSSCGSIKEVRLIMDRQTGRAKGFGYVDFATPEAATKALEFNNADFEGRYLRVDLAGSKPVPGNDNAGPSQKPPSKTVFIGGLSFNSTVESLTEAFSECGDLKEVRICKDQEGNSRGFGYAEFESVEAATKAIDYNETEFEGRQIRVNFADDKPAGGGRGGFGGGRGGGRGGFGGDRGGRGGFGGGRGGFGGGRGGGRGGFGGDRGGRGGGRGGFGGGRGRF